MALPLKTCHTESTSFGQLELVFLLFKMIINPEGQTEDLCETTRPDAGNPQTTQCIRLCKMLHERRQIKLVESQESCCQQRI